MKHLKLSVGLALIGGLALAAFHGLSNDPVRMTQPPSKNSKRGRAIEPLLTESSFGGVVTRLKTAPPEEIERWLGSLAPMHREEALSTLAAELADQDAILAESFARRIADDLVRAESVSLVFAYRFRKDPAAALRALRTEGDATLRSAIEKRLLPALADSDPVAAANWLAGEEVSPGNVEVLLASTIQRWAQKDAPEAGVWVATFEDPTFQSAMADVLVETWAAEDLAGLDKWLKTYSAESKFEAVRAAYSRWQHPKTVEERQALSSRPQVVMDGTLIEPCAESADQ